jgi:hypothetical protein
MEAVDQSIGVDTQAQADQDAIMRQWLNGIPAAPDVLRRVKERSQHATAEVRRTHGNIDVDALLREVRADS